MQARNHVLCALQQYSGQIEYALSKERYHELAGTSNPAYILDLPAKELLSHGRRKVEIIGPLLEEEASRFYQSQKISSQH